LFFFQERYPFTFDVTSFNQETPNPFYPFALPFEANLWIFVEEKHKNEKVLNFHGLSQL
jgi:hypothetical protein